MPSAPQNPSPMRDSVRAHRRSAGGPLPGRRFAVEGGLPRSARAFVPEGSLGGDWLLHFHGAEAAVEYAVFSADPACVAVSVNLGVGSGGYERALRAPGAVEALMEALYRDLGRPSSLWLSGFSAGYGGVAALLEGGVEPAGVLLLDGLHTGYAPKGRPLDEDGALEEGSLKTFLPYARRAAAGEAAFIFSHSAVFPGTYASTTECADWLLRRLGIERRATLRWGPLGMQQLSTAGQGGFLIKGFAGNTAPDHMDHLHALYRFFAALRRAAV